jgi:hypothetical protein
LKRSRLSIAIKCSAQRSRLLSLVHPGTSVAGKMFLLSWTFTCSSTLGSSKSDLERSGSSHALQSSTLRLAPPFSLLPYALRLNSTCKPARSPWSPFSPASAPHVTMSIIETLDADALSKIADFLTIEDVLKLAQTSKSMQNDVSKLPWYCQECTGPVLIDAIPIKCSGDLCGGMFCSECAIPCEEAVEDYCSNCRLSCDHCGKECGLCCVRCCADCDQVYCFDCKETPCCTVCKE